MARRPETRHVGRYRTSSQWLVRDGLAVDAAAALVRDWQPGSTVASLTRGQFGLADLILALVEQLGAGCSVRVATWALSVREVRRLVALVRDGGVRDLRILCDASIVARAPAEVALLRDLCGPEVLALGTCCCLSRYSADRFSRSFLTA